MGIYVSKAKLAFVCDGEDWKALQVTISDDGSKHAVLKNVSQKIKVFRISQNLDVN